VDNWKGQLIPYDSLKYSLKDLIGTGAFGSVYRGSCHHTTVAIKELNTRRLSDNAKAEFKSEVLTLRYVLSSSFLIAG
jgi:serine/threonine protein kinase